MEMETDIGSTSSYPDLETTRLEEEEIICVPDERVCRVMSSFEFRKGDLPASVPIGANVPSHRYKDLQVIGVVATIHNKEGLFAQCAWFGNYDCDWFWCRINDIQRVEIRRDVRFRGGERCAWLTTTHGDYAMLLPCVTYVDMWETSLNNAGPDGLSARVQIWPPHGTRPAWWSDRWKDSWPWDKEPGGNTLDSNKGWMRLGPHGDHRNPGEPLSHLHHLAPWVVAPNSGKLPTLDREDEESEGEDEGEGDMLDN